MSSPCFASQWLCCLPVEDATNYVVNAVAQIVAGETVSPDYVKPYGCTVKYRK